MHSSELHCLVGGVRGWLRIQHRDHVAMLWPSGAGKKLQCLRTVGSLFLNSRSCMVSLTLCPTVRHVHENMVVSFFPVKWPTLGGDGGGHA